jgi:hypothetical protein
MRCPVPLALAACPIALAACAQSPPPSGCTDSTSSAIVGGTSASSYSEAILVDMYRGSALYAACSGSIIAPQVVLTAGHCVDGFSQWKIKAPFANGQSVMSTSGETYDWDENGATTVNPNHHDIGLIYLQTPITLAQYPKLAQTPLKAGSSLVNIGRIRDGVLSNTQLYVSPEVQIDLGDPYGYPYDYVADNVLEQGDSGGPDVVATGGVHTIVAVNSGNGSMEVLARVDLLYDWIKSKIDSHGGPGGTSSGGTDAGTGSSSGGTDAGTGSSSGGSSSGSSSSGGSSSSSGGGTSGGSGLGSPGAGTPPNSPPPSNGAKPCT